MIIPIKNGNPLPANFFDGNVNLDGVEISNAPQFAMGLNADYDFANGFEVGLDVNHFSNLYEFNDVADVVAEGNSYETSKLDAYTLFDMTAAYTFDFGTNKMELRTNVYNLFNHAYLNQTDAFGVFYGNGRTFNASVTYRF